MKKRRKAIKPIAEEEKQVEEVEATPAQTEIEQIEEKVVTKIKEKKDKEENKPSRIWNYIKEEHKWETYVMLFLSVFTIILGVFILKGTLTVREDAWLIGKIATPFAWGLVIVGAAGALYSLWPLYKPAFPEFKKITWLTGSKLVGNIIRVFLFIIIFTMLFLLYDSFISQVLSRIFHD